MPECENARTRRIRGIILADMDFAITLGYIDGISTRRCPKLGSDERKVEIFQKHDEP